MRNIRAALLARQLCSLLRGAPGRSALEACTPAAWGHQLPGWGLQGQDAHMMQAQARCHSQAGSQHRSLLHTAVLPRQHPEPVWDALQQAAQAVDPFVLVQPEVRIISERLRHSAMSNIPSLSHATEYFFRQGVEGKRLRPTLVMLMASALSPTPPLAEDLIVDLRPAGEYAGEMRRRQQRVAEIAEMIHVATLLHDDVIDEATTRRGVLSLNSSSGNKIAILAGDFLLARASRTLASLRNTVIVELLSEVLENLVSGEVMQMTASPEQTLDMEHYLQKTYCKTASLMANSSRAVAVLGGHTHEVCDLAWSYGRHLGLAFQIVDDVLDLTASSSMLGKPAHNDLRSGLATAPVLFAAEQQPALKPLIMRRFKQEGDLPLAVRLIEASSGIERAKELARHHCEMAAEMIRSLPAPQSEHALHARAALYNITNKVLNRKK